MIPSKTTMMTHSMPRFHTQHRQHRARGFTLMEILIALAIVALVVGVTVTRFTDIFSDSAEEVAKTFVNSGLDAALLQFRLHTGSYPSTEEGIKALIQAPPAKASRWRGPYIRGSDVPLDPWGNPYRYRYPGQRNQNGYDLWSLGPDGVDSDRNIGNW